MAIAYPTPSPILKQPSTLFQKSINTLLKPIYLFRVMGLRLFWHTKAYSTIVGIMVLALFSIGFLWLYEIGRKLFQRETTDPLHEELNPLNQR
jgi:hypothetical protein